MTAVLTGGLAVYGLTTKRDFSGMASKLFFAMLALVAVSFVGMFVGGSLLQLAIGLGGAVIFSLYIIFEIQQARYVENTLPNAIMIAIGIYLSVFNLFLSLLRILGIFGGSSDD
jgi:FtsH-binding integral membrane protein